MNKRFSRPRAGLSGAFFACCAAVAMATGCNREGAPSPAGSAGELRFGAEVQGDVSRVSGTSWGQDHIGVFMTDASGTDVLAANKDFYTPSSGLFSAYTAAERIPVPEAGAHVDFYAYHPYNAQTAGDLAPLDISDQSNQSRLDVLYSNNLKDISNFSSAQALQFKRQMVRVALRITAGQGISSLTGLTAKVSGVPTKGTFDWRTGTLEVAAGSVADFFARVEGSGSAATVEMTIFPKDYSGLKVTLAVGGGSFVWKPGSVDLQPGVLYKKGVTLTDNGADIDPDPDPQPASGWIETPIVSTPAITSATNIQYVRAMLPDRSSVRNYSMLYDTKYKLAYWVAYPMHPSYRGNSGRTDNWGYDPHIQQSYQANLGKGYSGNYDRGHQMPSADRTYSAAGNTTTFYYTNMTPQNGPMNQGVWAQLEDQGVRRWMTQCDTLYVVTGAMITEGSDTQVTYTKDNSGKDVAVPKYYFKALAQREGNTYYTVAFKIANKAPSSSSFNSFRLTVSELETITGFTFFPSIDKSVKGQIVTNQWQ